jgi:transposase
VDLSVFAARYRNDETGAPAILLKIILYAYSRGITSSREIERLCGENIVFMALSADSQPHFTTIANFISTMNEEITPLFLNVLLICDEMGLIGKDMFAIDGCKLPSNASKEWSGTKAELAAKARKMEKAVRYMVGKHRDEDVQGPPSPHRDKEQQQIETLRRHTRKIREWLQANEDKQGQEPGTQEEQPDRQRQRQDEDQSRRAAGLRRRGQRRCQASSRGPRADLWRSPGT